MHEGKLTKYSEGGLRELFVISWPIILSSAASCLMAVVDRLILSKYSEEAFNSCFGVMQLYWLFFFTLFEFALITEIFVGQFNGAKRFKEIGPVVWQMILFCIMSYIIFAPLSLWGLEHLIVTEIKELGLPYLQILTMFVPINCICYGALTSFFVGRGETKIIPIIMIFGNVLNGILDYAFIFGIEWQGIQIIPEGGVIGAAIASATAQVISTIILFAIFLKKNYREKYNTLKIKFDFKLLKQCFKFGFPNSLNKFVCCIFWALITQVMVKHVATDDFRNYGIVHSIYLLFYFGIEGVSAGVRTICANAIGAKNTKIIGKNIKSWVILGVIFIAAVLVFIATNPNWLISQFLKEGVVVDVAAECEIIKNILWFVFAVLILDYIVTNLFSILIAAGDTKIVMYVNAICFIFISMIPTYIAIVYFNAETVVFWKITALDSCARLILFINRYNSGKWKKHKVI